MSVTYTVSLIMHYKQVLQDELMCVGGVHCLPLNAFCESENGNHLWANKDTNTNVVWDGLCKRYSYKDILGHKGTRHLPRTCQVPAETQDTDNDTSHRVLLIQEPRQPLRIAAPEFGGRRCARRMASSIRSGPAGARGVIR